MVKLSRNRQKGRALPRDGGDAGDGRRWQELALPEDCMLRRPALARSKSSKVLLRTTARSASWAAASAVSSSSE